MKKIYSIILVMSLMASLFASVSYAESVVEIHVSPKGSVTGDGSAENPVNTIDAARKLAQNYSDKNIKVLFHAGEYKVTGETKFTSADSGTDENSVVYTAFGDGEVEFTGATELNADGFKKVVDPMVLKKIPQNARTKVLSYNLALSGLTYSMSDSVRPYLYVNEKLKTTARYPNDTHLKATLANNTTSFEFNDYDVSKWETANDAILSGSTGATFFWRNTPIKVSGNVITSVLTVRKNTEFWVENLIEELDSPGEYFVDRETNILYYYPDVDLDNAKIEITSNFDTVISMQGAENITFDGLKFDKTGGEAFHITDAENVNIKNCIIDYSQGADAIYLKGSNCEISDNSFYGCANNVIQFHGGNVGTLTKGNILVKNNRISMCGYYEKNSVIESGVSATSRPSDFGNRITSNLIQDCMTFMGIVVNANDYLIDYNEIVNQGYLIGDGGAIYMGRSNTKHGMEVAYNYIHEGHKGDADYAYCGLYSDDGYGGSYFHHNVVADMYQGMILNVGMNCRFNNNLLINNYTASGGRSIVADYTVDGGMVENGHQELFYNEVNTILNKVTWGKTFGSHYPYLEETLDRVPYFAVWDSEVVGNVSIGCNGRGLNLRPWHLYYKKDGVTPVITGEDKELAISKGAYYYAERYIGQTLVKGEIIDEMKMYAKEIVDENGNDLNSTVLGNPIFDYDESFFKDPENQDYTLTDEFYSDVSTVNEIDMSKMSIISSTNPDIYKNDVKEVNLLAPCEMAENIYEEDVSFTWERVEDASKYKLVIANDKDLTDVVSEEIFNDVGEVLLKEKDLEAGKTYYWQVTAYGIAKNDTFTVKSDIHSFTTRSEEIWNRENIEYISLILDEQITDYNNGVIDYSSDTIADELAALSEETKTIVLEAATQAELDAAEEKVIDKLVEAEGYISNITPDITECYVDQDSDNVYVKGSGFKKNALVSVVVTNPGNELDSADALLSQIQYVDTVAADAGGNISFTFKTRLDGRDRSGDYTVYVRNADGISITKTYNYGIISAGEITYKNASGEVITDLSSCKGENVTMSCIISNDTANDITPVIITAFYEDKTLKNVAVNDEQEVSANSDKELSWTTDIDMTGITKAKVMFMDSMITLKPLTSYRVIFEKNVSE